MFKDWSLFQIALLAVGLMSGILSIVRELLAMYEPIKYQEKSVFWNCIVIAFIVSAGILLYQGRRENQELRDQLVKLTVPSISGELIPFSIAPAGDSNQDSFITAWAVVDNKGAPSILKKISIFAKTADGRLVEGLNVSMGRSVKLHSSGNTDVIWQSENYFPGKSSDNPVPTNGGRSGWIDGLFRGISSQQMHSTKLIVKFSDINDRTYSIEGMWANRPAIDPRTIQHQPQNR